MKDSVLSAIGMGRAKAKTQHKLSEELGINHDTVRRYIRELRNEGHEIMSEPIPKIGGYYICQTEEERTRFYMGMRKRAARIFAIATKLDNAAKMRNQETYLTRVRGAVR